MITPIFKLDSRERYRPQPVETVERLGKILGGKIALGSLPDGGDMVLPTKPKDPDDTPVVGYHRAVLDAGLWWHQFWLWYLYNDWDIFGYGKHEGDWEFVQIGCLDEAGEKPILVTASQHKSGGKRDIWSCERVGERPVIYVAVGSHANYFVPLHRSIEDAIRHDGDAADGGKPIEIAEWRPFDPAWQAWPGQWGHSHGEGQSPKSPGNQGSRWKAPHLYHASAH